MIKKPYRYLRFIFFIIGIFLLINPNLNITGAVIGSELNISSIFSLILGLVFVILAIAINAGGEGGLERKFFWGNGERAKNEEKGDISFKEYLDFLNKREYKKGDSELKEAYIHDFEEYRGINNESEKRRYLNNRLKEINEEDLDRAKEIREIINRKNNPLKNKVLTSEQAIKRSKEDSYIIENTKEYINEIDRISQLPLSRPAETIGDFKVSPRGDKKIRVAWRYKKNPDGSETILVDDLLYHVTHEKYVDNWIDRARDGDIKAEDYTNHKKHDF